MAIQATEITGAFFSGLEAFVPVGINPYVFYAVFLLVFGIVNSSIKNVKILNKSQDYKIHAIIAFAVAYFTATSAFATVLITNLFPSVGFLLIIGVFAMIITTFIAPEGGPPLRGISKVIMFFLFAWMVWNAWVFASLETLGYRPTLIQIQPQDWPQIILFVLVALGFLFMMGGFNPPQNVKFEVAPWGSK